MSYSPLVFSNTRPPAAIPQRVTPDGPRLSLDEPAMAAMTDFTRECPVAVSPGRHIDDALQDIIRVGVRALLVLEEGRLLGLITSYDILGERPIQFLQSPACSHDTCLHRDVLVADIMTPLEQLPTLARIFHTETRNEVGGIITSHVKSDVNTDRRGDSADAKLYRDSGAVFEAGTA